MKPDPVLSSPPARRRSSRAWLAGLLIGGAALGAAHGADADPPGRVGRISEVTGEVRTVNADGAWVALPRNQPVATGDRLITDKDGRAVLEIGSTVVRIGAYSDVSVSQLDDSRIRLHFDHGQMAVRVRATAIVSELTVETDEGVWLPRHPGYFRFDRQPGQALSAQAWSGDMVLDAADSTLPVGANQRAEVWREGVGKTTHYRMVSIPVDAFSDWALVSDRLDDRYAAASQADPVPVEMTGADDLTRYGNWSTSADYGSVWTPGNVATDWAPYQDGSWSYMAPWGWTWVDNSPWGFAPFHYGRWIWLGGRWCWAPGNLGPRPVYAPALVGWVGGPGSIGWVPLGPGEYFYPGYAYSPLYWNLVNVAPLPRPRKSPGPVIGRPRAAPTGPVTYVNAGAPGAVNVVPGSTLVPYRPVNTLPALQRPDHKRLVSDVAAGRGEAQAAPPAPPMRAVPTRAAAPLPAVAPRPASRTPRTPTAALSPAGPPVVAEAVSNPLTFAAPAAAQPAAVNGAAAPVRPPVAAPVVRPPVRPGVPVPVPVTPAQGLVPISPLIGNPTLAPPAAVAPAPLRPPGLAPAPAYQPPAATPQPVAPVAPAPIVVPPAPVGVPEARPVRPVPIQRDR